MFCVTTKFSIFETALRSQTPLSFIAVLPGPRFLWPRRDSASGDGPIRQDPSPACSLQKSIPRRAKKLWLDSKTVRGLSAWWGPRWKMKGSFNAPTSIPHDRFKGESKVGGLPLFGQGFGGGSPRGKGCVEDSPPILWGSLDQGEGPRSKALSLGAFPL